MFAKKALLLLCISIYSMNQVSCIKCYECDSYKTELCGTDPKQKAYERNCSKEMEVDMTIPGANGAPPTSQTITEPLPDQCLTVRGTYREEERVFRTCGVKKSIDALTKLPYSLMKVTNINIDRCDTDFCNSSSNLSTGFLSIMGAFLVLLVEKH